MDPTTVARCAELARCGAAGLPIMDDVLELLDRAVGADVLSVSELRLGELPRSEVAVRGATPLTDEEWRLWPQLLPTHPYLRLLATGPDRASRSSDAVPLRRLQRLEVYERLLRPRGSTYQAGLLLERTPTSLLLVSLWRAERDFTDREVDTLETLRRPLAAGLAYGAALASLVAACSAPAAAVLTVRQQHVVALVARGCTNEQIARRLAISPRTVRKHLEDAWDRTGTTSRAALAAWWAGAA